MEPRHADILDPQRLERRQSSSTFFPPELNPFRDRPLAVAGETEDEVAVRAPGEQLHASWVGRVRGKRVGRRVRAVDGRVVDVEGGEALVVFQAGVDVVAGEKQACCGDVLEVKSVSVWARGREKRDVNVPRRTEPDEARSSRSRCPAR